MRSTVRGIDGVVERGKYTVEYALYCGQWTECRGTYPSLFKEDSLFPARQLWPKELLRRPFGAAIGP